MSEQSCPKCGRALDEGKPCPVCLLQLAAEPTELFAGNLNGDVHETVTCLVKKPKEIDIDTLRNAFPQLEIVEQIGRGGMGTVFKARQPKLDRYVALKILATDHDTKPGFAERFAQEGRLLALLNHPNIVAVYDVGESDGFYYLIIEHVDGVNLRQAMREARFTPEQAIEIVPKICDALQYAHEEGVLHRDIKPENILLDTKGRVKIADFGIAKLTQRTGDTVIQTQQDAAAQAQQEAVQQARQEAAEQVRQRAGNETERSNPWTTTGALELTQEGLIIGTPSYMAPEQLLDPHRVDHRADIYSLGVVFYELLTGELPRGQFPAPSEKTPVSAGIDSAVMKALHKEREKRQQTAAELRTEIEAAPPISPPQLRGRLWLLRAGILFCILLGALGIWSVAERFAAENDGDAPHLFVDTEDNTEDKGSEPADIASLPSSFQNIFEAAAIGTVNDVKALLDQGVNINTRDDGNSTPLHLAAARNPRLEVTEFIVSRGADINVQNNWGSTPLHDAVKFNTNPNVIKYLVSQQADSFAKDNQGHTPHFFADTEEKRAILQAGIADLPPPKNIFEAAIRGTVDELRTFLNDENLWQRNEGGWTLLHLAAGHNPRVDVAEFLISQGFEADEKGTGIGESATPLFYAAETNPNADVLRFLIEQGADVNVSCYGKTALSTAIEYNPHEEVIQVLIENGADADMQLGGGKTLLHFFAEKVSGAGILKSLVSRGWDVHARDNDNQTPLYFAAMRNPNVEVVQYLVSEGADVNAKNNEGDTPLHVAAWSNLNVEVVEYLIEQGADVNARKNNRQTPLHIAVMRNTRPEILKALIDGGADVGMRDGGGQTPLAVSILARQGSNTQIMEHLIAAESNINARNDRNNTVLHTAAEFVSNADVIELMISQGMDVNAQGEGGRTPLHRAARNSNAEVIKLLVSHGAEYDVENVIGNTPLHNIAEFNPHVEVMRFFVSEGADVNARNRGGRTLLHFAAEKNPNVEVVKYLVSQGAEVNSRDAVGRTPLHDAVRNSNAEVLRYLVSQGAEINVKTDAGRTPLDFAEMLEHRRILREAGGVSGE